MSSKEFPAITRRSTSGNRPYKVRTATCSKCGKVEEVKDNTRTGMPTELTAAAFRKKGWAMGSRRSGDLCPDDARKLRHDRPVVDPRTIVPPPPTPLRGQYKDEKFVETVTEVVLPTVLNRPVIVVEEPLREPPVGVDVRVKNRSGKGQYARQTGFVVPATSRAGEIQSNIRKSARSWMGKDATPGEDFLVFTEEDGTYGWKPLRDFPAAAKQPVVEQPNEQQPIENTGEQPMPTDDATPRADWTPARRRQARDALDQHYNETLGRYDGDWSDVKLAQVFDLPRALVSEVREMLYGPDTNEQAHLHVRELKTIRDDAEKLMERHMALAADAESLMKRAKKALGEG